MFKCIRGCLPKLFKNYYIRNVDIHCHVARQQNKLHTNKWQKSHEVLFHRMNYLAKCVTMLFLCCIRALKTFFGANFFCYKSNPLMYIYILFCSYHVHIH